MDPASSPNRSAPFSPAAFFPPPRCIAGHPPLPSHPLHSSCIALFVRAHPIALLPSHPPLSHPPLRAALRATHSSLPSHPLHSPCIASFVGFVTQSLCSPLTRLHPPCIALHCFVGAAMRRRSSGSATASTTRTPRPSRRCVHPSPLVLLPLPLVAHIPPRDPHVGASTPPHGCFCPSLWVLIPSSVRARACAAVPSGAYCSAPPFGCSCPSPPLPCSRGAAGAGARHRRERRRRHRHLRLLLGGLAELPPAADGGHAPPPRLAFSLPSPPSSPHSSHLPSILTSPSISSPAGRRRQAVARRGLPRGVRALPARDRAARQLGHNDWLSWLLLRQLLRSSRGAVPFRPLAVQS